MGPITDYATLTTCKHSIIGQGACFPAHDQLLQFMCVGCLA